MLFVGTGKSLLPKLAADKHEEKNARGIRVEKSRKTGLERMHLKTLTRNP